MYVPPIIALPSGRIALFKKIEPSIYATHHKMSLKPPISDISIILCLPNNASHPSFLFRVHRFTINRTKKFRIIYYNRYIFVSKIIRKSKRKTFFKMCRLSVFKRLYICCAEGRVYFEGRHLSVHYVTLHCYFIHTGARLSAK